LYHLMSQFFHDVYGCSVDAVPDPLSMIVRTMSVEARAISLSAEMRPTTGSVNTKIITGTSETVTVVASEAIAVGTNSTVFGSAVEV